MFLIYLKNPPLSLFNLSIFIRIHDTPQLHAQNLNTIVNPSLNKTQVLTLKTNKHLIVSQSLIATLLNTCSFQASNEQSIINVLLP